MLNQVKNESKLSSDKALNLEWFTNSIKFDTVCDQ